MKEKIQSMLVLIWSCIVIVPSLQACESSRELERAIRMIRQTIEERGHKQEYECYTAYTAKLLDDTSGEKWWNEKNGLFRLSTVDRWLRKPLVAPTEAEQITHNMHLSASSQSGLPSLLNQCSLLLDLSAFGGMPSRKMTWTQSDALGELEQRLNKAERAVHRALDELSSEDLAVLRQKTEHWLINKMGEQRAAMLTTGESKIGERGEGAEMFGLMARVDLAELRNAALPLWELVSDSSLLSCLSETKPYCGERIVIGSTADDTYDLDESSNVRCVIDLGGNDTYKGGRTSSQRPVLVIIDLDGDDSYLADGPFAQGCGFLGVSVLLDRRGNDTYKATDGAQGCGLVGVGLLMDEDGNDVYEGDRRVQGVAVCGIGALIDRSGDDRYRGHLFAQGHGGVLGVGLLEDTAGDDHYTAGGKYGDQYQEPPQAHRHAWSQGCGSGFRGSCNGGFGILLDGDGDDLYEADFFSTGGYWFAAGLSRDFAGNDVRRPLTTDFVRWGSGYGCHYGVGVLIDDTGDDRYCGGHASVAFGWDIGLGALLDFRGNDSYSLSSTGGGVGLEAAWGILYDGDGADTHVGTTRELSKKVTYHPKADCGGNFSFIIDSGQGEDVFPGEDPFFLLCKRDSVTSRGCGDYAAYLIDIP